MTPRWLSFDRYSGVYLTGFDRFVKIGWSASVGRRLREIEEYTPERLTFYTLSVDGTAQEERRLHRHFWRLRTRKDKEWFYLERPLSQFIEARRRWLSEPWRGLTLNSWSDWGPEQDRNTRGAQGALAVMNTGV